MKICDPPRYFGKYRGMVMNNVDPLQTGRLLVQVSDVLGPFPSSWAMPSVPYTGKQMGMWCLPQVGTGVWVEFEQGDPDKPVWSGAWYGSAADVPALGLAAPPSVPNVVLQTTAQNTILVSDLPGPAGGILLKARTGAFISISDNGITISNGQGAIITMIGNAVDINMTALTVK